MQHIVLIKQSPMVQLAHLYEHIFCDSLSNLFTENGLYVVSDYFLMGHTYYGGIIYISLELYTDDAIKLGRSVADLDIPITQEAIMTAASQIVAEKELPFGSDGYEKVEWLLTELQAQAWQNIDDITQIDTKSIRRSTKGFYVADGKGIKASKIMIDFTLDEITTKSRRDVIILFRQLGWFLSANLQATLPAYFGVFSDGDVFKLSREAKCENTFKMAHGSVIDVNEIAKTSNQIIDKILESKVLDRFIAYLRSVDYTHDYYFSPDIERTYEDTNIIIGSKGWRTLATKENGNFLRKHMVCRVRHNKEIVEFNI